MLEQLITALITEIKLLRTWTVEMERGSWSTYFVRPMRLRADELEKLLYDLQQNFKNQW
jgi:hypothetical protein